MRLGGILAALTTVLAVNDAHAGDQQDQAPLRIGDAAWLAPGADVFAFLVRSPGECLRAPENEEDRYLVEVGRAAFRSPLLLGGPAARGGLSCNSCHRDGRDNPDFFLEGLSGAPGTADITSSLFSKTRDDGVLNPLPIPSLVDAGGKASFGGMTRAPSLHAFISGAVTEEFQGASPPAALVAGLAAYVGHLESRACPAEAAPASVTRDMQAVERALAAAETALGRGDPASADFLLLAAQHELENAHERFEGQEKAQAKIESLARAIAAIRPLAKENTRSAQTAIAEKRAETQDLARFLHRKRSKSLYEANTLARRLAPD